MTGINEEREALIAKINKAYIEMRENRYFNPMMLKSVILEPPSGQQSIITFKDLCPDEIDKKKREIYTKALIEAARLYDEYLKKIVDSEIPSNTEKK